MGGEWWWLEFMEVELNWDWCYLLFWCCCCYHMYFHLWKSPEKQAATTEPKAELPDLH
jgi:Ni/Fe-hydrogenase subunit HybB-like protein